MSLAIQPRIYPANFPSRNLANQKRADYNNVSFTGIMPSCINKANAIIVVRKITKGGEWSSYIAGAGWLGLATSVKFFGMDHSFACQEAEKLFHVHPQWIMAFSCCKGIQDLGLGGVLHYAGKDGAGKLAGKAIDYLRDPQIISIKNEMEKLNPIGA